MSTGPKRRIAARLRVAFVRLAITAVALVTLFGVLRAGASYVYCPMMARISDAPCCAADRGHHSDTAPELRSLGCCEHHLLGKLPPAGSLAKPPPSFTAPFVAMVPAPVDVVAASLPLACGRFDREGRAGPMARERHRAELMVFLN